MRNPVHNQQLQSPLTVTTAAWYGIVFLLVLLWSAPGEPGVVRVMGAGAPADSPRIVYFFYHNPCASCREWEKIYDLFRVEFDEGERRELNYELRAVNVFTADGRAQYQRICEGEGRDPAEISLPVLVCGDRWISGYDSIREQLRAVMEDPGWVTAAEAARAPGPAQDSSAGSDCAAIENAAGGTSTSAADAGEKFSETYIAEDTPDGRNGAELDAFLEELAQLRQLPQEDRGQADAVLFVTTACHACENVEKNLPEGKGLTVRIFNITQPQVYAGLTALLAAREIEKDRQQVPCLFVGSNFYSGEAECIAALQSLAAEQAERETAQKSASGADDAGGTEDLSTVGFLIRELEAQQAQSGAAGGGSTGNSRDGAAMAGDGSDSDSNGKGAAAGMEGGRGVLLMAFLEGIAVGLNPCSLSMLLMLLSVLLSSGRQTAVSGGMYLAGKFVLFALVGVLAFRAAEQLSGSLAGETLRGLRILLAVLFALLALLNFRDGQFALRGEYGRIRMQLPTGIRRAAHRTIRSLTSVRPLLLPLSAFVLGIVISAAELFCAGQLYLASILSMARSGRGGASGALLQFAVCTAGILLPSTLLVAVISASGRIHRVSAVLARHEAAVKFVTAALFAVYAVYIWVI